MAIKRQKNIYATVQYQEKPSFVSVIFKTFIGSSLILYGLIMMAVMFFNQRYIMTGLFLFLPFIGIKIMKRKSAEQSYKESFGDYDSL
jgi:hypothetical protein